MAAVNNIKRTQDIDINYTRAINYLIDSISWYENVSSHTITLQAEGPVYGCSFIKANDNIFGGIIFGYNNSSPVYFTYNSGDVRVYKLYV